VTAISLDRPPSSTGEVYLKVGRRGAMEVAVVGLAARLSLDEERVVSDARVAVCSVAPAPFRAPEAERELVGTSLEEEAIAEAGRLLEERAQPIDDARATAAYRRRLLAPLLRRALLACRERADSRG
jgi:carbon-monoxide dehydrogenase medium subunit